MIQNRYRGKKNLCKTNGMGILIKRMKSIALLRKNLRDFLTNESLHFIYFGVRMDLSNGELVMLAERR